MSVAVTGEWKPAGADDGDRLPVRDHAGVGTVLRVNPKGR